MPDAYRSSACRRPAENGGGFRSTGILYMYCALVSIVITFTMGSVEVFSPFLSLVPFVQAVEMAHAQSDTDVATNIAFGSVRCGGKLTLDSLSPNMPGGSASSSHLPYYPSTTANAGPNYVRYFMRNVSPNFARLIEDTIQTSATNVLLFEIDATSVPVGAPCYVMWDPRGSWVRSVEVSSLSFAVFDTTPSAALINSIAGNSTSSSSAREVANAMCNSVQMGFNGVNGSLIAEKAAAVGVDDLLRTSVFMNTLNTRFNGGNTIVSDTTSSNDNEMFPVGILAPPQCTVTLALIATRYGRYTALERWLPLLIYSVLFVPMILIFGRRGVGEGSRGGVFILGVAFVGYAGCCVGLGIELATWSYPLHPFPFPGAVTMYFVASICYGIVLLGLLYNHPLRVVATHTAFNMLLYGLSIGLMVGYFMRAFLIIGVIAVCLLGVVNLVIIILSVWFASVVPQSFRLHTGSSHVSTLLAWFPLTAPVVPVTFFSLQLGWSGALDAANRKRERRRTNAYAATSKNADHVDILGGALGVGEAAATMVGVGGGSYASVPPRKDVGSSSFSPNNSSKAVMSRLAMVSLHSVFSSLVLVFVHNVSTLALLIAACIYHAPFVVAVFPTSCLLVLHVSYSLQEYSKVRRLYGGGGGGARKQKGLCGGCLGAGPLLISLKMAIQYHNRLEDKERRALRRGVGTEGGGGYAQSNEQVELVEQLRGQQYVTGRGGDGAMGVGPNGALASEGYAPSSGGQGVVMLPDGTLINSPEAAARAQYMHALALAGGRNRDIGHGATYGHGTNGNTNIGGEGEVGGGFSQQHGYPPSQDDFNYNNYNNLYQYQVPQEGYAMRGNADGGVSDRHQRAHMHVQYDPRQEEEGGDGVYSDHDGDEEMAPYHRGRGGGGGAPLPPPSTPRINLGLGVSNSAQPVGSSGRGVNEVLSPELVGERERSDSRQGSQRYALNGGAPIIRRTPSPSVSNGGAAGMNRTPPRFDGVPPPSQSVHGYGAGEPSPQPYSQPHPHGYRQGSASLPVAPRTSVSAAAAAIASQHRQDGARAGSTNFNGRSGSAMLMGGMRGN